jgi:hypothetical protein
MKLPLTNSADLAASVSDLLQRPYLSRWIDPAEPVSRLDGSYLRMLGFAVMRRAAFDAEISRLMGLLANSDGTQEIATTPTEARKLDVTPLPNWSPSIQQTTSSPFDVLRKISTYRGLYTRVARRLGVTPSVVRRVALNKTKSARISKELEKEILQTQRASSECHQ